MVESDRINSGNYDVFISYYSVTGRDFARYLKEGLRDFGINAFLDEADIPKSVEKETDEWRSFIDEIIRNSPSFFLIMTTGFNKRKEVLRELAIAFENKKRMHFFKHENSEPQDLTVELNGKSLDISKYEYVPFSHENELVRKAVASLLGKLKREEKSFGKNEAKSIASSQGGDFKRTTVPIVEVVVGPSQKGEDWLLPTRRNEHLISHFPHLSHRNEIIPRRELFECTPNEHLFLRLRKDGFLHVIQPLITDLKDIYYIDIIAQQVFEVLAYFMRVMRFLDYELEQSVLVILRNLGGKQATFTNQIFVIRQYRFANQPELEFSYEFSPKDGWKGLGQVFVRFFKDLCFELGCIEIEDSTIKKRVYERLCHMQELRTEYTGEVRLPRVDINDFGLC